MPLAVVVNEAGRITMFFCSQHAALPTELLLTNRADHPAIDRAVIDFSVKQKDGAVAIKAVIYEDHTICFTPDNPPWSLDYHGGLQCAHNAQRILWIRQDNVDRIKAEFVEWRLIKKECNRLEEIDSAARQSIKEVIVERLTKTAYDGYIAEFGDPELWNDYKKTLRLDGHVSSAVNDMIRCLVERHIDVDGMTVQTGFAKIEELGLNPVAERRKRLNYLAYRDDDPGPTAEELPIVMRTPPPEPDEEEDDRPHDEIWNP